MSFIASLVASGTTALLSGTAAGAMLGAGGTAVLGGVLGGAATGAAMEGIRSGVTGTDFNPEGVGIGALTGGVMSGLGAAGNAATAAEQGVSGAAGQTIGSQGIQTVSTPVTQIPTEGTANAFFNSASNPVTQYANLNTPMQSAIGPSTLTNVPGGPSIFANGQPLSMVGDLGQKYNELGTMGKTLTAGGIGLGANMALGSDMTPSAEDEANKKREGNQAEFLRYLRNYRPTLSPGYAAGGITDLDGYMSQAQNIPNPMEVADPSSGYGSNSVQQMAHGGIADLGGYAKGGIPNLLHGPGDGVSDDIPASIADRQPARLASGEYVVSARIVSELGNGSTDAGAKRLDEMVRRVQAGRKKTIGSGKEYAKDTKPYKHLPV